MVGEDAARRTRSTKRLKDIVKLQKRARSHGEVWHSFSVCHSTLPGLAVAVQITGRSGVDALVLGVSKALEDAIGWAGLPE